MAAAAAESQVVLKTPNADRLIELLNFDRQANLSITSDAFKDVLAEINHERAEKARVKTKEVLIKAIDLRQKSAAATREFIKTQAAFDKEMGKLVNQLNSAMKGEAAPVEEAPAAT